MDRQAKAREHKLAFERVIMLESKLWQLRHKKPYRMRGLFPSPEEVKEIKEFYADTLRI